MITYRFLSPGWARRFARNARGRGYVVRIAGATVTVDQVDNQLRLLVQRYAGVAVVA